MNYDNIFTNIYLWRVIQYYQVNVLELMLNLQEMQVSLLIETTLKEINLVVGSEKGTLNVTQVTHQCQASLLNSSNQ